VCWAEDRCEPKSANRTVRRQTRRAKRERDLEPSHSRKGRCPLEHYPPYGAHESLPEVLGPAAPESLEEVLVPDARAGLTPSDMVERKLLHLLRGAAVAGSQVRMEASRMRGARPSANHLRN